MDLHHYTLDGLPMAWYEKIIARNFLISDIAVIVVSTLLMIFLCRRKLWNWQVFCIVCIPSIISGLSLGAIIYTIDPEFPGWIVPPWSSLGWIGFWCVEDLLFYTFVTVLFYGVYRFTHQNSDPQDFKWAQGLKYAYFTFLSLASLGMLIRGGICGKLETLFYAVPSLIMMVYAWRRINCKRMLIFIGVMVVFESLWDWFAVSWLYYYKSWAPGWIYITWNAEGVARFSRIFLDPVNHKWAWIFNNPIDITPWYGIAGASFIYMAINAAEVYLVRRKHGE